MDAYIKSGQQSQQPSNANQPMQNALMSQNASQMAAANARTMNAGTPQNMVTTP